MGDVLKRNGDNWTVVTVEEDKDGTTVVKLRPGLKPAWRGRVTLIAAPPS